MLKKLAVITVAAYSMCPVLAQQGYPPAEPRPSSNQAVAKEAISEISAGEHSFLKQRPNLDDYIRKYAPSPPRRKGFLGGLQRVSEASSAATYRRAEQIRYATEIYKTDLHAWTLTSQQLIPTQGNLMGEAMSQDAANSREQGKQIQQPNYYLSRPPQPNFQYTGVPVQGN